MFIMAAFPFVLTGLALACVTVIGQRDTAEKYVEACRKEPRTEE